MRLENEYLLAEIANTGAELTRIYDKTAEREVLWEGNPVYWKRHSPILFPNVGKTWNNTVKIQGKQYDTCQHGFARDMEFEAVTAETKEAVFVLRSNEETKKKYPYDFELYITYKLEGKTILVEWEVKNPSEETICFTIGGHPAFRFEEPKSEKENYILRFPGKETLEYILVDPATGTGVPQETYALKLENETCPLNEEMFEKDALIFDGGQIEEVWLCRRDGSPYVGMHCEDFTSFGIWSVKGAPFVCLEPWAGRCDNVGFDQDISEKPGVNEVRAKENFCREYRIIVA